MITSKTSNKEKDKMHTKEVQVIHSNHLTNFKNPWDDELTTSLSSASLSNENWDNPFENTPYTKPDPLQAWTTPQSKWDNPFDFSNDTQLPKYQNNPKWDLAKSLIKGVGLIIGGAIAATAGVTLSSAFTAIPIAGIPMTVVGCLFSIEMGWCISAHGFDLIDQALQDYKHANACWEQQLKSEKAYAWSLWENGLG